MATEHATKHGRRFGLFLTILINGAILYAVNYIDLWDYIPYLTKSFTHVREAFSLSLCVTIFMYCTFMAFDRRWFRSLMQAIANVFAAYSIWIFRQVFPLDLTEYFTYWVNIGLLILIGIMMLSTLIELGASVRHYRRSITN